MTASETGSHSRVLTLVFTDLADSTALKTERGDMAVGDLIARHREHVARIAADSSGRIIDWAGDGCFLTFETSSAAVLFSLRLQQAHADEADLPGVRIGVHLGEVTEKPGPDNTVRIEGLAVDIAARVSGLARPGQVLMSSSVYNSARQRMGVEAMGQPILWQLHGAYDLKGFDHALEIGEVGLEGLSPLEAPESSDKAKRVEPAGRAMEKPLGSPAKRMAVPLIAFAAAALVIVALASYLGGRETIPNDAPLAVDDITEITSIAVLPLKSLSDDPNHEYLADGLTDSITSELAKIRSLKVISNTSAVRYKNTDLTMPEIAKALGVDGLIEGSLFREGNDVRITVQLIHGPSDAHVWSESYTGTITSIMQLQSEVALAIADALGAKLTGEERSRIASAHEVDPEAYDAWVIGQHYLNELTEEGLNTAIRYFEQAVDIDPEYAHGWGGMVCAYWEMAAHGLGRPREIYPKARSAGMRALQLNADMSTDQSHMGMIAMGYDHEWDQAEERFQFALRFAPSNSFALHDYARFLSFVGRDEEALQYVLVAEDLDPMPTLLAPYLARETIRIESDPQRARRNMEQLRAANPEFLQSLGILTRVYRALSMRVEALDAAEEWVELARRDAPSLTNLAMALGGDGQHDRVRELLDEIAAKDNYFDSAAVGYAYISLDDLDAAFEWLEMGYDSRDWGITRLRTIPYWKIYIDTPSWIRFRNDPRYWDLIERVGFPPLPPEHAGYEEEQVWLSQKAAAEQVNH